MTKLPPSVVTDAHGYTRSKTPWILGDSTCGKLIHYLSGGGMKSLGRTVDQEVAHRRHQRFFACIGVIAAIWTVFYFV